MILRGLERRPGRALLSALGIALATAVLVAGRFSEDSLARMIDVHFLAAEREDLLVAFADVKPARAAREVARLPGALSVEPFRAAAVRLRNGSRTYRTSLLGLPPEPLLRRVVDRDFRPAAIPDDGLLLSKALAELLEVRPGERLEVEFLEGARRVVEAPVRALVDESIGSSAYASLGYVRRLLREGPTITGVHVAADPARTAELYRALKARPGVSSVSLLVEARASFERSVAEMLGIFRAILVAFAATIAFGVVYNTGRIALAERARELATLRVLGFTRGEISAVLIGELGVLTVAGIPAGFAIGYGLAAMTAGFFASDLYRMPLVVARATYAFAAAVVLATALVTALVVRRRLDRLDLVEVLKARE